MNSHNEKTNCIFRWLLFNRVLFLSYLHIHTQKNNLSGCTRSCTIVPNNSWINYYVNWNLSFFSPFLFKLHSLNLSLASISCCSCSFNLFKYSGNAAKLKIVYCKHMPSVSTVLYCLNWLKNEITQFVSF